MMAYDIIGREIREGDYVFSGSYMYLVTSTSHPLKTGKFSHGYVIALIHPPSKTSRTKTIYGENCCVIPKEEYLLWILKKGH